MTAKRIKSAILVIISVQLASSLISTPECVETYFNGYWDQVDFNGYWDETGTYNNNPYYTLNGNYLFLSATYNSWTISPQLTETGNVNVLCLESNILSCSSNWYYIDVLSKSWAFDSDAVVADCTDIVSVEAEPMETSTTVPPECVAIKSLQHSIDGYWAETGTYNENPYYMLNGNYLFRSIAYNSWVISTQLRDTTNFNVFCLESNVLACSSKWYYIDEVSNSWTVDSDAVTLDCGDMENSETTEPVEPTEYEPTEPVEPTEYEPVEYAPFECVGITSLQPSMYIDFNGYWHELGVYNNKEYYTLNGYYLFASTKYDLWIISRELRETGEAFIFCAEANVEACSSKWFYIDAVSYDWTVDVDAVTFDCDTMDVQSTIAATNGEEVSPESSE